MNNSVKGIVKGMVDTAIGVGGVCLVNVVTEMIPEPVKLAATIGGGIMVGHGVEKTANGVIDLVTSGKKVKKND